MRKGMADHLMPPRVLLEKVAGQANGIALLAPEATPFAQPFAKFPKSFSAGGPKAAAERGAGGDSRLGPSRLREIHEIRARRLRPERTGRGRHMGAADGPARYAFLVKDSTTTDLTPEQIHEIGLAQVKEIEAQMLQVVHQLGYKDLKSFTASLPSNPKVHVHSRQAILDLYQKYINQMYGKLPQLFGRLPEGEARSDADRRVPREGGRNLLRAGIAGWVAARARDGQYQRLREGHDARHRNHGVSRRRPRPPPADRHRAGNDWASAVSPE